MKRNLITVFAILLFALFVTGCGNEQTNSNINEDVETNTAIDKTENMNITTKTTTYYKEDEKEKVVLNFEVEMISNSAKNRLKTLEKNDIDKIFEGIENYNNDEFTSKISDDKYTASITLYLNKNSKKCDSYFTVLNIEDLIEDIRIENFGCK